MQSVAKDGLEIFNKGQDEDEDAADHADGKDPGDEVHDCAQAEMEQVGHGSLAA